MNDDERWSYLLKLDDELLKGGVILSEWCSFIVCEADTAFGGIRSAMPPYGLT